MPSHGTFARAARAWRERLEAPRAAALPILAPTYGTDDAARWVRRRRVCFLACEEPFAFREGTERIVSHHRLEPGAAAGSGAEPRSVPRRLDGVEPLLDTLGRALRDLRVSVTDRCTLRCVYCMPRGEFGPDHAYLPRAAILTFEEIVRLARIFASLGVEKIRLTGGEPLLRRDLPVLVRALSAIPGLETTLTTNGLLLDRHAVALRDAGLSRLTVSLDSLDDAEFRRMTDSDVPVARVLDGIAAAQAAGFRRIKVNAVVRRGFNDRAILPLAARFRGTGHVVRFIEYMDVGATNGWRLADVVSAADIVRTIHAAHPLEPVPRARSSDTAETWRYADGAGEVGVVASVTRAFCRDCVRARLSAEGTLHTCLFATGGHALRGLVRDGSDDATIADAIRATWRARDDRYSELRGAAPERSGRVEMSYIGG